MMLLSILYCAFLLWTPILLCQSATIVPVSPVLLHKRAARPGFIPPSLEGGKVPPSPDGEASASSPRKGQKVHKDALEKTSGFCPETIGAPVFSCKAPVCGGENKDNSKHCNKQNPFGNTCQCDANKDPPPAATTVVRVTKGGETATATYDLVTIPSMKNLKQSSPLHTTVTGDATVVTVAAQVFAGGVAWVYSGYKGAQAGMIDTIEPPGEAEGHEDDPKCKDAKEKCSDCKGVIGICTTGDATGCLCDGEEENCPAEDQKPKCSDPQCDGNEDHNCTKQNRDCDCKPDGDDECPKEDQKPKCSDPACKGNEDHKCTKENRDCDCEPDDDDECPEEMDGPFCNDCGGSNDGRCKDHPPKSNAKDCPCVENVPESGPYTPFNDGDLAAIAASWKSLPVLGPGGMPTPDNGPNPAEGEHTCQKSNLAAPQRDNNGKPSVASSIDKFCKGVDRKKLVKQPKGVDRQFSMFPVNDHSFWLSAEYRYDAPEDAKCGDEVTVIGPNCARILNEAMMKCDPGSGDTHGATLQSKCIRYEITIDVHQLPANPPWNRKPLPKPMSTCNKEDTDTYLQAETAYSSVKEFCTEASQQKGVHGGDIFTKEYHKNTPGQNEVSIQYPGKKNELHPAVDEQRCQTIFKNWLDICNLPRGLDNQWNLKHGGTLDDQGYKYILKPTGTRYKMPLQPGRPHLDQGRPDSECTVKGDQFVVRGRGFSDIDYGKSDDLGLVNKLANCGIARNTWKFEYNCKKGDIWEWVASGSIPLGPKQAWCVKEAAKDAGSKNDKECNIGAIGNTDGDCPKLP